MISEVKRYIDQQTLKLKREILALFPSGGYGNEIKEAIAVHNESGDAHDSLFRRKQDNLTAGGNIQISGSTISATDTKVLHGGNTVTSMIAGSNVSMDNSGGVLTISATDTKVLHGGNTVTSMVAGSNVSMDNSGGVLTISATGGTSGGMLYPIWREASAIYEETEYRTTSGGLISVSYTVEILGQSGYFRAELGVQTTNGNWFYMQIISVRLDGNNAESTTFSGSIQVPVASNEKFKIREYGDVSGLHSLEDRDGYFIPYVDGGTIEQVL